MHMLANPKAVSLEPSQLARLARTIMRASQRGILIRSVPHGSPVTSRVRVASKHDGAPILQFIKSDAENAGSCTLVVRGEMANAIVGIQGTLSPIQGNDIDRFFRRHTEAEATDASLGIFQIEVSGCYIETGDERIRWIELSDFLFDVSSAGDLAAAEAGIVEHVNGGHPDSIHAIMSYRGLGAEDWVLTGVDPEGVDVSRESTVARVSFDHPVHSRDEFKKTMIALRTLGGGVAIPPQVNAAE